MQTVEYPLSEVRLVQRQIFGKRVKAADLAKITHPILCKVSNLIQQANGNAKSTVIDAEDDDIIAFLNWLSVQPKDGDGFVDDACGLKSITIAELMARKPEPFDWLVEGMIARGQLVVLAGRPKSGKSWLILVLAQCLDNGTPFLGRETKQSKVLLITLEDGEKRVRQRCHLLKWKPTQGSCVAFQIESFDDGNGGFGMGLKQIAAAAEKYDLIIIDTLIRTLTGKAKENDNMQMGAIVNQLADIAHRNDTTIILVHHTGKGMAESIFDTLRGASAIRGAYDVGLVLERKQEESEAILHGESRDIDLKPITIRQAANGTGWDYVGNSAAINKIRKGRKVVRAMLENDPKNDGLKVDELVELLEVSTNAVRKQLRGGEELGYVYRQPEQLPDETAKDGTVQKAFAKPADLWFVAEPYRA